jgi:predicted kinase
MKDIKINENKYAIVSIGLPGSGKSTEIRKRFSDYYIVDADEIKATHPDYDPKNTEPLHQWSVKEAELMMQCLSDDGVSICMDSGGVNNSYSIRIINMLKSKGYHITLVHMDTPLEVCLKRNSMRARMVPEHAILEKHTKLEDCLERQIPLVDKYIKVKYQAPISGRLKKIITRVNKAVTKIEQTHQLEVK